MIKQVISLALGFSSGAFFIFGLVTGALGNHVYAIVDFVASATIIAFLFWQIIHGRKH